MAEAIFFLLVLKIPVIYLALVVWWAVRPSRDEGEPVAVSAVSDTPPGGPGLGTNGRAARRPVSTRPHGPRRTAPRPSTRATASR